MRRKKTKPNKPKRLKPVKDGKVYRQLWRLVDGAVKDAFMMHSDYLTPKGIQRHAARNSINKRVVGAILSYAGATRAQGRSGAALTPAPAVEKGVSF